MTEEAKNYWKEIYYEIRDCVIQLPESIDRKNINLIVTNAYSNILLDYTGRLMEINKTRDNFKKNYIDICEYLIIECEAKEEYEVCAVALKLKKFILKSY